MKKTPDQLDALMEIRSMAPLAVSTIRAMLKSKKTPAAVKAKLCEMILDRTYGKPEASIRVTNAKETVKRSLDQISSLVKDLEAYTDGAENFAGELPASENRHLSSGTEAIALDEPGKENLKHAGDLIPGEGGVS